MRDYHQKTLDNTIKKLTEADDICLILLDGSLARGEEREDSDVDLIVVVTEEGLQDRLEKGEAAFFWKDVAEYPDGYAEGRFVSRTAILEAVDRGSEPTRFSYLDVKPVWGEDAEIMAAIPKIAIYPEWDQHRRITSFVTQALVSRFYYFEEGKRQNNPFLTSLGVSHMILFAARTILAVDKVLFPSQKRLMEVLATCPSKPATFDEVSARVLKGEEEACDEMVKLLIDLVGPLEFNVAGRFVQDVEMSWFTRTHDVAEW